MKRKEIAVATAQKDFDACANAQSKIHAELTRLFPDGRDVLDIVSDFRCFIKNASIEHVMDMSSNEGNFQSSRTVKEQELVDSIRRREEYREKAKNELIAFEKKQAGLESAVNELTVQDQTERLKISATGALVEEHMLRIDVLSKKLELHRLRDDVIRRAIQDKDTDKQLASCRCAVDMIRKREGAHVGVHGVLCDLIRPCSDQYTRAAIAVLQSVLTNTIVVNTRRDAMAVARLCADQRLANINVRILTDLQISQLSRTNQKLSNDSNINFGRTVNKGKYRPLVECVVLTSSPPVESMAMLADVLLGRWWVFEGTQQELLQPGEVKGSKNDGAEYVKRLAANVVTTDGHRIFADGEIRNAGRKHSSRSVCWPGSSRTVDESYGGNTFEYANDAGTSHENIEELEKELQDRKQFVKQLLEKANVLAANVSNISAQLEAKKKVLKMRCPPSMQHWSTRDQEILDADINSLRISESNRTALFQRLVDAMERFAKSHRIEESTCWSMLRLLQREVMELKRGEAVESNIRSGSINKMYS